MLASLSLCQTDHGAPDSFASHPSGASVVRKLVILTPWIYKNMVQEVKGPVNIVQIDE